MLDNNNYFKLPKSKNLSYDINTYIPFDGEVIKEQDTDRIKIGDGITKYNDLPYYVKQSNEAPNIKNQTTKKYIRLWSLFYDNSQSEEICENIEEYIPIDREVIIELDGGKERMKIGNGKTRYNDLPYVM